MINTVHKSKKMNICFSMLLASMVALGFSPADAATSDRPIDAGQLLNELEPERHILPEEKSTPEFAIEMPKRSHQGSDELIYVESVELNFTEKDRLTDFAEPNKKYSLEYMERAIHELIDPQLGGDVSFNTLVKLAEQATEKIRNLGYPTAIIYMPKQDMKDHQLTMNVVLGSYAAISVDDKSMVSEDVIKGYVHAIQPGDLIYAEKLNKQLLILNDLAGVRAKASLTPGEAVGTAKLNVDVENLETQGASVYVDNYGSQNTGRYRYGIGYHYNNIAHRGDQIQGNYVTSNLRGMDNYLFQYEIPVGREGAKVRTSFSRMTYDIWSNTAIDVNYTGNSKTLEVGTTIPLSRAFSHASFLDLAYRHRWIEDNIVSAGKNIQFDGKSTDVVELALKGYARDAYNMFGYQLGTTIGALRANTNTINNTHFEKSAATMYYIRKLSPVSSLYFNINGQWSYGHNLDSSEDIYIGGPNGVRAFTTGEASGDVGVQGTFEYRYDTPINGLQLSLFYDVGYVRYNANPLSDDNSRTLAGAGIGLTYSKSRDWYMKLDIATPLSNKYSQSYGKDNNYMVWFRLVKQL